MFWNKKTQQEQKFLSYTVNWDELTVEEKIELIADHVNITNWMDGITTSNKIFYFPKGDMNYFEHRNYFRKMVKR